MILALFQQGNTQAKPPAEMYLPLLVLPSIHSLVLLLFELEELRWEHEDTQRDPRAGPCLPKSPR